jgi:hypothetical protein
VRGGTQRGEWARCARAAGADRIVWHAEPGGEFRRGWRTERCFDRSPREDTEPPEAAANASLAVEGGAQYVGVMIIDVVSEARRNAWL